METSADCSVRVAVHIRPLVGDERIQNCKECVVVTPQRPQVQIGAHSFTFDHVYGGSDGAPSSTMFEECISPLVDGLFQGYNATVLAYGQTGSGKTYTMGTGAKDSIQMGLIPQAMNALFSKIGTAKHQTEFQLRVSFIEILKEEVKDLLDSVSLNKVENANGATGKVITPGRQSIYIRETSNGAITLAGTTEVSVTTLQEMASCLEHGLFSRATGSTNMNNASSRSHAIFTITVEQMSKIHPVFTASGAAPDEDLGEEYVCAKLHLVDLAGSERAKRTGSDGLRLKEGIHINKGLLALGNVISALGDDKKRKECAHVPYRDSKLTRLLQDSLGGNSKTVMIACISPADINAEETLNTLKYANRARNIRNKPVANRDLISTDEIQRMRQQLEYLQAELCARGGVTSHIEMQVLKERIARLESTNLDLCRELHEYRSRRGAIQWNSDSHDGNACVQKSDGLKRGFHTIDSSGYEMGDTGETRRVDVAGKEREHELLQNTLDEELNELNKQLEQKESEMRFFGANDFEALKHHFGKKILELEEEKRIVQRERDQLLAEVESLAANNTDRQSLKVHDTHSQKLRSLEAQILELKKKQNSQVQLIKEKHRIEEAAKRLQAEIRYIKAQKVQLQHQIKHEAEQFRLWKASREKELLQLRREGRRNEYERHKLEALNQRQKMVLQRKTEEAAIATKRLKELLEFRKSARYNSVNSNGQTQVSQNNGRFLQRWLDHELEVVVNVHEVRFEYEKQSQVRCALAEELALLKQVEQLSLEGYNSPSRTNNGYSSVSSLSPDSRKTRIESVENMLRMSSNALVDMASQLSEAEERERSLICRGRWNQLRSMGDAKNLLQYMFNTTAEARCQFWEKNMEINDMKDQVTELVTLLRISETQRKELLREQKLKEQTVAIALAKSDSGNSRSSLADNTYGPSSAMSLPAPKQLKFTPSVVRESAVFLHQTGKKMVPIGQASMKNLASVGQAGGKLWRWKRSHHQWLLQFKWKWQKPWRLSEWIKHSDETIIKPKSKPQIRLF